MESLKTRTHIGADGILKLELPVDVVNADLEVLVVIQPLEATTSQTPNVTEDKVTSKEEIAAIIEANREIARKNGWPDGFFEQTYGSMADDPIERPAPLPFDVREEF